jgi:hypothetical protein
VREPSGSPVASPGIVREVRYAPKIHCRYRRRCSDCFSIQAAEAKVHKRVDPTLSAVSTGVGAGWTAGYFAINHWNWKWNAATAGISQAGAIVGTTMGCAATSPMVGTAVLNRPLTYREAHILIADCVIPFVGGWLVNEAYNNGTFWAPDEKPVRRVHDRHRRHR